MAPSRPRARRRALLGLVALSFVFSSPLHSPLNNPNEYVRVYMVKAMVDGGTFAINDVSRRWGWVDDKAKREGKLYSSKAPLMSMLGAGAYALARPVTGPLDKDGLTRLCRLLACVLPCLLLLLAFARLLLRRVDDEVLGELTLVGVALGTGVLAYALVFSGHAVATLCCGVAFLAATDDFPRRDVRLLLIGLTTATAVGAEYPALVAVVPVLVLVLWRERRQLASAFGLLAAGGAVPVALVCIAHHQMFGAPWKTGYSFIENAAYQRVHAPGLFGITWPLWEPLETSLISAEVGLFFYTPFLAAGVVTVLIALIFGMRSLKRGEALALTVGTAALCAFIGGHSGWRGGWVVGPRYIWELGSLLAVPAAFGLDAIARRAPQVARTAAAWAVGISVIHCGVAGVLYPHLPSKLRNPVYEFLLPTLREGFAADTWLSALGAPRAGLAVAMVLLAAPFVVVGVRRTAAMSLRLSAPVALGVGLALLSCATLGPGWAQTASEARAATEVRRVRGQWRPTIGNAVSRGRSGDDVSGRDAAALGWPRTTWGKLDEGCGR